jgi:hypothetical protein
MFHRFSNDLALVHLIYALVLQLVLIKLSVLMNWEHKLSTCGKGWYWFCLCQRITQSSALLPLPEPLSSSPVAPSTLENWSNYQCTCSHLIYTIAACRYPIIVGSPRDRVAFSHLGVLLQFRAVHLMIFATWGLPLCNAWCNIYKQS